MEYLEKINSLINGIVWGPFMLCVLLGIGVFYTIKLNFFQITQFRLWWNATFMSIFKGGSEEKGKKSGRLSPFQAMATALAGAIGTGNIVGVAGALTLGGAGAVFWMWVAAVFGMGTIFAENVLGVKYREKRNGSYVGGPMYYIEKGLKCKWAAVVFAVICTVAALGMGNMTQANSVSGALAGGFGISPKISGVIIAGATAFVIFGGIDRIAALTEKLVPLMAVLYTLAALTILVINFRQIPYAFSKIITEAFDLRCTAGGFMGYGMSRAVKYGISRGVFSNEAGLGSSPIVHAAAETDDPYRQGMWGMFQVFIDTIVLCTLMALCIITTGFDESGLDGVALSTAAFESVLGFGGKIFISVSIVLFAFATLVSWCYYGEKSLEYLSGNKYIYLYRIIYAFAAYLGSVMGISLVWEISDTLNGLMAIPNLAALILLSKQINYHELKLDNKTKIVYNREGSRDSGSK
ncbi:MAG: sodium:alanine symporter family protein [Clostridia bacterium]|nr:sodium:alanine symporter family protein [Clostridia bacterium]